MFNKKAMAELINEGFLTQLEALTQKYAWSDISFRIFEIVMVILNINNDFLGDLLGCPSLYWKLLNSEEFLKYIS